MRVLLLSTLFVAALATCVLSHPLFLRKELDPQNIVCRDGMSECSDGDTCCETKSGNYACCPLPNAVCCPDKVHCCPNGDLCEDSKKECLKKDSVSFGTKLLPAPKAPEKVICPDQQSECPSNNTCCKSTSGGYACCSKPSATCCPDHRHCCPSGYKCDSASGSCKSDDNSEVPFLKKVPAINSPQRVKCPNNSSSCDDGNTCCLTTSGDYGCCPKPDAVCCADKVHCCPKGYTCEKESGVCRKGDEMILSFEKLPLQNSAPKAICPGGKYICPDNHTCCNITSEVKGCCPINNAVCCDDGMHCCPEGFTCGTDNSSGLCTKSSNVVIQLTKLQIQDDVVTPPDVEDCPGCPYSDGVCCPDGYCCPAGYTCMDRVKLCVKGDSKLSFLERIKTVNAPTKLQIQDDIVTPPDVEDCPGCPYSDGVCCPDGYCCPAGYTCMDRVKLCVKGDSKLSFLERIKTVNAPTKLQIQDDIVTPPDVEDCPGCPYSDGVCCPDGYCCPAGYTCMDRVKLCVKGDSKLSFLERIKTVNAPTKLQIQDDIVTPPDVEDCPGCPYSDGVCCPDGYCCPAGYTCMDRVKLCVKGDSKLSFLERIKTVNVPTKLQIQADIVTPPDVEDCPGCPYSDGVCCPDGYCCPAGYTCMDRVKLCVKGDSKLSFLERIKTVNVPTKLQIQDDIVTPPDVEDCPGCPYSDGVCCPDGYCCPAGYTCMDRVKLCVKGDSKLSFLERIKTVNAPTKLQIQDDIVTPPDVEDCPGCPYSDGVCCPDGYCCPAGYTCMDRVKLCVKGDSKLSFLERIKTVNAPENVVCPDGQSECSDGQTCCKTLSGYGCCPVENAVCCADGKHCCPSGDSCHVSDGKCLKGDEAIPFLSHLPTTKTQTVNTPENVICPDNKSECSDGQTCCEHRSGNYGCCPSENAVCCSDDVHCCPEGYKCDVSEGKCLKGDETLPFLNHLPSVNTPIADSAPENTRCPDELVCPTEKSTCCKISSDVYGCCPHSNAVCCDDKKHCCPENYNCHDEKCFKKSASVQFLNTLENAAITLFKEQQDPSLVECPDKQSVCPDGDTCCKTEAEGKVYGCCPENDAVCCSDGAHCCPKGYTCDDTDNRCKMEGADSVPFIKKTPSTSISLPLVDLQVKKQERVNIECPDSHDCNSDQTCCALKSGGYGCCHFSNAVCCSDKVHCCPPSFDCDVPRGICTKDGRKMPFLQKLKVVSSLEEKSLTSDEVSRTNDNKCQGRNNITCTSEQTCCPLPEIESGCCPMVNAECCGDRMHCCPNGFSCDIVKQECIKSESTIPLTQLVKETESSPSDPEAVNCPDKSKCPDAQTCCITADNTYGCCKHPQAQCCEDKVHCCPKGFVCDKDNMNCKANGSSVPFLTVIGIHDDVNLLSKDVPCPDNSVCSQGQTCCISTSDKYACCPVPNAVCCSDDKHCCPEDYKCDVSIGRCKKRNLEMAFLEKLPSLKSPQNVICPDEQSACPDKYTCCKDLKGQMSCCDIENAVCCSDGEHCCPKGFDCDPKQGICTKSSKNVLSLVRKQQPISGQVICPGSQNKCPAGNTCCKMSDGDYGCCPEKDAVCCSDKYCCPHDYTCDVEDMKCFHNDNTALPILVKTSALRVSEPQVVVCGDGKTTCPNKNTCCKLETSGYACCANPQATCCNDHIHCCPHGYKCDPGSNKCSKDLDAILAMLLTPPPNEPSHIDPQLSDKPKDSICSDREHWCPDNTTCCAWGCCPISDSAVCCGEMEHCCATGYTCGNDKTCVLQVPMVQHTPSAETKQSVSSPSIECPDQKNKCPKDNTCCKSSIKEDTYGCCPTKEAVCCSDLVHCCPRGTECDTQGGKCRDLLSGISSYKETSELLKLRKFVNLEDDQFL